MVDTLHNEFEQREVGHADSGLKPVSLDESLQPETVSEQPVASDPVSADKQLAVHEIKLSRWQRSRVWLAEQCVKIAPELSKPIYTKLVNDRVSQLALIRARARENQVSGLALVETFGIRSSDDVLSIAKPFLEQGPQAVLTLIHEADVRDSTLRSKLACLSATKHAAETLQSWSKFGCDDEKSQREFFNAVLPGNPEVAIRALTDMPVTAKTLRESVRLQAVLNAPRVVLDSLQPDTKDDCEQVILKAFQSNRSLVLERIDSLPMSQSLKEDLLKETAFHKPTLVLKVINPKLVPDAEVRKTLALLCSFGEPEATAAGIATFAITSPDAQEELALHLAQKNGSATAAALSNFSALDSAALTRVVLRCLKSSWWGTVQHLAEVPLPSRVRDEISAGSAERDPVRALKSLSALKPGNAQIYRSIVLNAARKDAEAALESLEDFSKFPYSLRKEFAMHCAEQAPVALANKLTLLELDTTDHEDLIEVCLRTDFWDTLKNARCFTLSETRRNGLLRQAASKDIHKAVFVVAELQASDIDTFREIVVAYSNSKPSEAANNKALWSSVPDELRFEAAQLAAQRNARVVAQGIKNFQIDSEEKRGEIFALCVERNARDTVAVAADFDLPQNILERFMEPLLRSPSPERDLEILESLNIPRGSTLYMEAAKQAIESSTRKFCNSFERYGIHETEQVIELAALAAERNPSALLANIAKFSLPEENLLEVLISCSAGNPRRAVKLCNKFSIPYRGREAELALACARHDITRAYKWAEERLGNQNPIANEDVLSGLFVASIRSEKVSQSMKICEHKLKLRGIHPTAQATMELFDQSINDLTKDDLQSEAAREQVQLLKSIRQVQVAPNQTLLSCLRHFDDVSQRGLLLGFLGQAGPSFGENILDTLRSGYPRGSTITDLDRRIVGDVISGGFRGFSSDRLTMLREAYERSRVAGKRLLEEWSDISKSVLTGIGVSKDIRTSKQYVDYVIEAFRPSGMNRADVKRYLETVNDHSDRLNRFSYPHDGYAMSLVSIENVSLKEGVTLNEEALAQLGRTLQQVADTPASKQDFFMVLTRAAQRATGQIDRIKFLAYLTRQETSLDLGQKIQEISAELVAREYSEKRAYQLLTDLQESLSSAIEAALDSSVPPLIGDAEADRNDFFIPSQKHLRSIRRMLDLAAEDPMEKDDIAYALAQELGKVFHKDVRMVSKELDKIYTGAGAAAGDFKMYMSLSQAAFFGRAGAGLCTATDTGSWNDRNYLQMMMVDTGRGRIVGNVQLHLFKNKDGQPAVLARLNPTAEFVGKVDKEILAQEMLRVVEKFADDNNLVPYLPEQTSWHNLTNRNSFAPHLKAQYGRSENTPVRITRSHSVSTIYKMKRISQAA